MCGCGARVGLLIECLPSVGMHVGTRSSGGDDMLSFTVGWTWEQKTTAASHLAGWGRRNPLGIGGCQIWLHQTGKKNFPGSSSDCIQLPLITYPHVSFLFHN